MSEQKHTPGPWDWFSRLKGDEHIKDTEEFGMRFLTGSNGQGFAHTVGLNAEQDVANANLIAAAPELLEAGQEAIKFVAYAFSQGIAGAEEAGRNLEAAIAKAEGKS